MTVSVSITRWALLGLLLVLMSCSGGTGGSGIDNAPGKSVVVFGAVTNVDRLVVNGITFDTTDAIITLNSRRGAAVDLQLGQVVTVRGKLAPSAVMGTAETVTFERNAQGPIARVDATTNSLVVLEQIVRVDDTTQFGTTPLSALIVGNIVELSGFVEADGVLRATRVEKTQNAFRPGTVLTIEGTISNLDAENQTFMLNRLQVDFSAARLINLPEDRLRNGQVVAVRSLRNIVNGVLFANRVEVQTVGIHGDPGEAVEFQGIITRGLSANNTFEVNGQRVRLTSNTVFERGTADNIAVDVRVEVEGVFNRAGTIVAEEVEFGAGIELEGTITRVRSADTFEVEGQLVRHTDATVFEGGTADDIEVDVHVEVEGSFDEEGALVAAEIDFFSDLEGTITRGLSADNTFEVDGQRVRLTPLTVFERGTAADITVGVSVEVAGFFDEEGTLVAAEIDFLP
jgi:hypothetical protein